MARAEIRVFPMQAQSTGDFVLALGATFEDAQGAARSSLDIDEDEEFELVEDGDVVEFLIGQYGGACVCSGMF